AEGSAENIFLVQNGALLTPDTTSALDGITRRTIIELAREFGIPVIERRLTRDELYVADGEAGVRFYGEVLGWESQTVEMEGGSYPMLVANGRPVAGVQSTRGNPQMADVPPHWAIYVAVDD
ncbi:aminotransferase class IV, partial [Klebsiella pneumoniae]